MFSPKTDTSGNDIDTTASIVLYDGEKTASRKFGSSTDLSLFDYSSTPTKGKGGDVFYVNFLAIYDYSSFVGNDDRLFNDNRDLFNNGAYVKVDAILQIEDKTEQISYKLNQSLLEDKVEDFTFDAKKISSIDFKDGFKQSSNTESTIKNIKIEGLKTYNSWVVGKYLWWHCLCAFAVLGLVMTGFYFIFTYEEKGKIKKKKTLRKK